MRGNRVGVRAGMLRRSGALVAGIVVAGAVALGGAAVAAADEPPVGLPAPSGPTTVTPGSAHGFAGTYDRGRGSREFTDRFGAPPEGGPDALVLSTPGDEDKVQFLTGEVAGPLERFRSSSYYALRAPSSTADPGPAPSFQIGVDINGGRLEPRELWVLTFRPGTDAPGTWNRYDTGAGRYCLTRQIGAVDAYEAGCGDGDPQTLDEIIEQHPGVSVLVAGVNQGGGEGGLVGAVDLMQVGSTVYDFERAGS